MKKTTIMFALMLGVACTASAQKTGKKKAQKSVKTEQVSNVSSDQEERLTLTKEVYPQKEENSNLYHGLTKKLTFDRMIPPHGLEVTYDKTVHILFPASVKYVDLGSEDLIAGKADGAENVIRVKAAVKNFKKETNMSVITEDGSFYTFNVKYANEPLMLNIEMADFIHDGEAVNRPNNAQEIYLKELGKESHMLVHLIMKSIHKENKRKVKHIGSKRFGIQYLLKGIYVHSDCCISTQKSRTRATCRLTWTISRSRWWTRRWRSEPPFRSRCFFLSVPTTMWCVWLARKRSRRCSACRNLPFPTTRSLSWR